MNLNLQSQDQVWILEGYDKMVLVPIAYSFHMQKSIKLSTFFAAHITLPYQNRSYYQTYANGGPVYNSEFILTL
jgi:hypothetical protein